MFVVFAIVILSYCTTQLSIILLLMISVSLFNASLSAGSNVLYSSNDCFTFRSSVFRCSFKFVSNIYIYKHTYPLVDSYEPTPISNICQWHFCTKMLNLLLISHSNLWFCCLFKYVHFYRNT